MGRGIKLTEAQWDELDRVRFPVSSAKVFRNCLIVLKSDLGETIASIAGELGCGTDTVVRVRRLYRQGGVQALYPQKPPGRKSRATPEFLAEVKEAVQSNPLMLGYGFSTWSAPRLAAHLAQKTDNVLFATLDDLAQASRRGVARINGHRNRMGFMFDHDDLHQKAA